MNTADMLTSAEAAEILGVDRSTLSRWSNERLSDRRISHYRLSSGAKLYDSAEVHALRDQLAAEREEAAS